jgi:hypothetical protein
MTNTKQQTAVEWLFNEIERIDKVYYRNTIIYTDARKEAHEKAKEMEKEQIINTWSEATAPDHEIELFDAPYIITQIKKAEQYYNETYGDGKQ